MKALSVVVFFTTLLALVVAWPNDKPDNELYLQPLDNAMIMADDELARSAIDEEHDMTADELAQSAINEEHAMTADELARSAIDEEYTMTADELARSAIDEEHAMTPDELAPSAIDEEHAMTAADAPVWFSMYTQLCYKWRADGDGGQCGDGSEPEEICAHVGDKTSEYRDDTDNRPGGCRMTWGIRSPYAPDWFKNDVKICYRWYPDGDGGQCGGGADQLLCAPIGSFTAEYRDDTDNRSGGCRMSWMLSVPLYAPTWLREVQLCYIWRADSVEGQCGAGEDRELCAYSNHWTTYYRDDTDNRGGGCRMSWELRK